jgi:lysophospholipase L1-like esterase
MGATPLGVFAPEDVYHNRLKKLIEQKFPGPAGGTVSVINSGIGGDTATVAPKRLDRDVIRYQPDLVLVAFGTNDLGAEPAQKTYEASLCRIIREIREKTSADIILLTPPFVASRDNGIFTESRESAQKSAQNSYIRVQNEGVVARFAEIVRCVGRDEHVPVADVYAEWEKLAKSGVDTTAKLANGLNHPVPEMHEIPARKIFEIIKTSFKANK